MASKIKVDTLETANGSGSITLNNPIAGFESTGIDDNATSTAVTIDASENVGIGTSSITNPYSQTAFTDVNIDGTWGGTLSFKLGGTTKGYIGQRSSGNGGMVVGTASAEPLLLLTNNTEAMRINTSGVLCVGVTGPTNVNSKIALGFPTTGIGFETRPSDGNGYTAALFMAQSAATVGSISCTASATAYNTSSDYRLKTNVTPMVNATAAVKLLKPCNFDWIADGSNVNGFLAHELAEVVPEAATGTKDAMKDEEYEVTPATETTPAVMGIRSVPDMQGIDQSKLVPLLTATIQELIVAKEDQATTIQELIARIEALEGV